MHTIDQPSGESWDEQLMVTAQKAAESAHSNRVRVIDWDWVQRAVVATEPPRLTDVPAHIAFCQKWGGGVNQTFTKNTVNYLNESMRPDRIVSGSFLKSLGNLKCTPQDVERLVYTVHACV